VDDIFSTHPYANRFLYTGREFLKEANLYDYRNRVYSVELGRFLQTDPIRFEAGDGNLYRYVGNGVADAIDPSGLATIKYTVGPIQPDADENFGTGSLILHKINRNNPAAKVIWTKPCGEDVLESMEVTQKPTPGSGGYISGENVEMQVETRYALFHSRAEARAARAAKFVCIKCTAL
jgi:RHS repeat-associated protein